MKFVHRAIAILVVMTFMLLVAMYLMKSIQGGEPMTPEALLAQGKHAVGKLWQDVQKFAQQIGPFFGDLLKKLPKPQ